LLNDQFGSAEIETEIDALELRIEAIKKRHGFMPLQ
jgi:hypothetical protein